MKPRLSNHKAQSKILRALREQSGGSTVADIMMKTGVPKGTVDALMPSLADSYGAHLKVTESGEILYHFPNGVRKRERTVRDRVFSFSRRVGRVTGKVLTVLFKAWIAVMLVGYFALFVGIVVLSMVASVAGSAASRGRSRGGGFLSFYFTVRIAEMFLWLWFARGPRARGRRGRPLHTSAFSYVFGEPDPNAQWEERERKSVLSHIRENAGITTADELMTITGRSPDDTQAMLNRLLVEFSGDPDVTEGGTLIYRFPELLRTSQPSARTQKAAGKVPSLAGPQREMRVFSANPKKTNRWLSFFNVFNAGFGTYFIYYGLTNPEPLFYRVQGAIRLAPDGAYLFHFVNRALQSLGSASNSPFILMGLGIVPVAFSVFFFLIPFLRRMRERRSNNESRRLNLRKRVYAAVMKTPLQVAPLDIRTAGDHENPPNASVLVTREVDALAAARAGDVELDENSNPVYRFPEIERDILEVRRSRRETDVSGYDLGDVVFDTSEPN